MPKKIVISAAMLAEYVARGEANKISIINAFSGDVVLQQLPIDLQFGVYLELQFKDARPASVSFEMTLNRKKLFRGTAGGVPSLKPLEPAVIAIPAIPMRVEADSVLELFVSADGYRRTLAFRKRIFEGAISASVSPPPSEQSPPASPETSSQREPSRRAAPKKRRRSKAQ